MEFTINAWKPGIFEINRELAAYQGSWCDQNQIRIPAAQFLQTGYFLMHHGWRAAGVMLLGMALYKWKILTAERSLAFYVRMTAIGLITGYLVVGEKAGQAVQRPVILNTEYIALHDLAYSRAIEYIHHHLLLFRIPAPGVRLTSRLAG